MFYDVDVNPMAIEFSRANLSLAAKGALDAGCNITIDFRMFLADTVVDDQQSDDTDLSRDLSPHLGRSSQRE